MAAPTLRPAEGSLQRSDRVDDVNVETNFSQAFVDDSTMCAATSASEPDRQVVLQQPFTSINDALGRIKRFGFLLDQRDDPRAVFVQVYYQTFSVIRKRIDDGWFNRPDWVTELSLSIANRFREAFVQHSSTASSGPQLWQRAHRADNPSISLLLCIDAHIRRDISNSLIEVGLDPDREAKREDYQAINDQLQESHDRIKLGMATGNMPGVSQIPSSLRWLSRPLMQACVIERTSAWKRARRAAD